MSIRPFVLLGGKGVRVSTSFINAFPWYHDNMNPISLLIPSNIESGMFGSDQRRREKKGKKKKERKQEEALDFKIMTSVGGGYEVWTE